MEKKENQTASGQSSRRDFLRKTTTAAALVATTNIFKTPVYGQSQAPSTGKVIGANDKITVAVIGIGPGIGQNHLKGIHGDAAKNNVVIAAACDLFNKRRDWAQKEAELKDADVYSEYRKIIDRKDIDAVVIATHDPWHAPITIAALESGKHVYCEKPMSRYLGEAFSVYDTVKRTGKVFQVGTQGCSAGGWQKCAQLIQGGKIGELVWGQGYYCRNSVGGEWNSAPFKPDVITPELSVPGVSTAANIDWNTWQSPVHDKMPFSAERFHRWRKFYPYCAGVIGDLMPHRLHPLVLATGKPEFPLRVSSIGTTVVHADKNTPGAEPRDVPEHQQLIAQFPSGYMITLTAGTVTAKSPGFVIYGHKATLNIGEGGNKIELVPEREFSEEIDPETFSGMQAEDIRVHEKNFFDCIRNGNPPNANIDLAVRVQTILSLAEMSNRMNVMCLFDEKTRTITTGDGKKIEALTYGSLALS